MVFFTSTGVENLKISLSRTLVFIKGKRTCVFAPSFMTLVLGEPHDLTETAIIYV